MARSLHVRLDDAAQEALRIVRSGSGVNDSEAVRQALHEAATRRRSRAAVRAEVAEIMADPVEVAEIDRVRALMDDLAAPTDPD